VLAILTTIADVGIIDNMSATLIMKFKNVNQDGSIIEMVVWKVSKSVAPSEHMYKYRLVFIKDGVRVIGFDNERGKGDHYHLLDQEFSYSFINLDTLIDDFIALVKERGKP
jgi:hypothetical protein